MKILDYNHIFLYAKHWYERTKQSKSRTRAGRYESDDVMKDLQTIIGKRCGLDSESVDHEAVFSILFELVYDHCDKRQLTKIFTSSIGLGFRFFKNEPHTIDDALKHMLDGLSCCEVEGVINIGEPSNSILPITEMAKKKISEGYFKVDDMALRMRKSFHIARDKR